MRRLAVGLVAVLFVVSAAACSSSSDSGGASSGDAAGADASKSSTPAIPADDRGNASGGEVASGEVPDPCSLFSGAELTLLLGSDPGAGEVSGPVPDERKICRFDSGLILAVEIDDNWDATVASTKENLGDDAVVPVPGVALDAYWQPMGSQFVARGDSYLVGVTLGSGSQETGEAVAEAMLVKLAA
jgi:hypothetical protein